MRVVLLITAMVVALLSNSCMRQNLLDETGVDSNGKSTDTAKDPSTPVADTEDTGSETDTWTGTDSGTEAGTETGTESDTDQDTCSDGCPVEEECAENSFQACSEEGDYHWFDSCGNLGAVIDDCPNDHGICGDEGCACEPGWTGDDCGTCVVLVDGGIEGVQEPDGITWETAYANLQNGIEAAAPSACEVWVTTGVYTPSGKYGGAQEEHKTFALAPGVRLYGGFNGDEKTRQERGNPVQKSELSGQLEDGFHACHVVTGAQGSMLDGFVVRDGEAYGSGDVESIGAGLIIPGGTMTVANCTFKDNSATEGGSAIHVEDGELLLENSTVTLNTIFAHAASKLGGSVSGINSDLRIFQTEFVDNLGHQGGGVYAHGGSLKIFNCVFTGNNAYGLGGAIFVSHCDGAIVANTSITANSSYEGASGLYLTNSNLTLSSVTMVHNACGTACDVESVIGYSMSSLTAHNSILYNDPEEIPILHPGDLGSPHYDNCNISHAVEGNGLIDANPDFVDPHNPLPMLWCSPALQYCSPCVDTGNTELVPADAFDMDEDGDTDEPIPFDIFGNPRVSGAQVDMGAHEFVF